MNKISIAIKKYEKTYESIVENEKLLQLFQKNMNMRETEEQSRKIT